MGAGASATAAAELNAASVESLQELVTALGPDTCDKIKLALAAATGRPTCEGGGDVGAIADDGRPPLELAFVVDEVFRCYDADLDGLIGKDEYLECCEKVANILDESFGPKQRRVAMQWYKDAGATGTPIDGMFLEKDLWREAFLRSAREKFDVNEDDVSDLAVHIWDSYAKRLVEVYFPAPKPDAPAWVPDLPAGPSPTYPMTIPLTELAHRLEEAKEWGRRSLVLSSNCSEVETFFRYKIPEALTIDCNCVFLKNKSELKSVLCSAMDYQGLCAPVLLKLGGGTFDLANFCCEEFPADLFSFSLWTPSEAHERGFLSESMLGKLETDPRRWKDFFVILMADLVLEEATANLAGKIPHYDEMAILAVDPESIAPG
mmetsp:Transcript_45750/g.126949  ORF Transcript_45750/g.126949 Transcript_45750/m.126949 type:complete len:376 (+) Transcript_45750:64-1191(+)